MCGADVGWEIIVWNDITSSNKYRQWHMVKWAAVIETQHNIKYRNVHLLAALAAIPV
jgi:hypothetical protein